MLDTTRDTAQFRKAIREWLSIACPTEMQGRESHDGFAESDICWGGKRFEFSSPAQKTWMENAASQGMTVPTWPTEYGGAGLSREQQKIWIEELSAVGAKLPLQSFGIWMLGPALLAFGTEEQKKRFLPEIERGEIRWCQGYSEPGAGSDLANVQTKAEDMGDHWLINGQKIWTSGRLDFRTCAHGSRRAQTQGHQLYADRHDHTGRDDQTDSPDFRQIAVLRNLL